MVTAIGKNGDVTVNPVTRTVDILTYSWLNAVFEKTCATSQKT